MSAISATFPGIDRDVAVTGALLHDIGKLEAYTADPLAIDMTDLGKLQGEIPLGYYRIRRLIEDLPGFPDQLAAAVLHIILAHHGTLEHGSPVVPCTREATLVHMIDNLGGRLGSFDRLEKELPDGSRWSPFDRAPVRVGLVLGAPRRLGGLLAEGPPADPLRDLRSGSRHVRGELRPGRRVHLRGRERERDRGDRVARVVEHRDGDRREPGRDRRRPPARARRRARPRARGAARSATPGRRRGAGRTRRVTGTARAPARAGARRASPDRWRSAAPGAGRRRR